MADFAAPWNVCKNMTKLILLVNLIQFCQLYVSLPSLIFKYRMIK